MRSRIIRIGNSRGVRIPKPLLEQAGLKEEIELHAEDGRIVIATPRRARAGWADAARQLHAAQGDVMESTGATAFEVAEWKWR